MSDTLEHLRRAAKDLRKSYETGAPAALERLRMHPPFAAGKDLTHANFLYVIAREAGFASWPKLKEAAELYGLDRAQSIQKLKVALFRGQNHKVQQLLAKTPDLAEGHFALQVALLNRAAVEQMLAQDPGRATALHGQRRPILHLAFSTWIHTDPDLADDMTAIAQMLVANGADVNDSFLIDRGDDHPVSALYGAIGHANNMGLAWWLLENGADPNDGESLYHATELGHDEGLKLLLKAGADPRGTNALLRAMDFNNHTAVEMLLDHGARADDLGPRHGRASVPALHHAARRMSDVAMIELLLDAGADPALIHDGVTAYGFARVFGNTALARAIEARGTAPALSAEEHLLAAAADGRDTTGQYIDPASLPESYRAIMGQMVPLSDKQDHMKRLVAVGVEYDRPDAQGVTPIQTAGWCGLPETLAWLLSLGPDLGHVNGYGGTLLSTIVHGSEHCPERAERDHIGCARLVLDHGVALPRAVVDFAGDPALSAFLQDWAARHPGQVV